MGRRAETPVLQSPQEFGTTTKRIDQKSGLRALPLAGALLTALGLFAVDAGAQEGRPLAAGGGQLFSLPRSADAVTEAQGYLTYAELGRWDLAVETAQGLVAGQPGDLLPEAFPGDRRSTSQQPHHLGVADWAREQLRAMPRAGFEAYEQRYGPEARTALDRAMEDGGPHALLRVASRYPAAAAAARALWAAGDLQYAAGRMDDARLVWGRAADLSARLGDDRSEALRQRLAALDADSLLEAARPASFRLPGPGEAPGPVPTQVSESWTAELPDHPFAVRSSSSYANLVPLVHEERVYVNTTLEVLAYDAFSGDRLWRSDQPAGWDSLTSTGREELEDALDRQSQLVAPAASSGVVVGALQIPYAFLSNEDYQGFVITRSLPDRRLFAFDAETGETLWSHEPPAWWDGSSGTFVERMSVAGSPVIAGGRVLAPMCRMDGRVDFHLAAFELQTGELLWSTPIISGQRELNMFNRHEREFSAPPVRIEGDHVLVLSQLGTVAAVDLMTGATRWQAVYEQEPLPKTPGLISLERNVFWKNAPPVVADDVVLATPLDSDQLIAVSLNDGSTIWSEDNYRLTPSGADRSNRVDVLLGVHEGEVVLGGGWAISWRKPQGLDSWQAPLVPGSLQLELGTDVATGSRQAERAPRPSLGADRLLVPGREALFAVPLLSGDRRTDPDVQWDGSERGNVAVGPGAIYVCSNRELRGLLDLSVLEERVLARIEAAPGDLEAIREYARLMERRAGSEFDAGRTSTALGALGRARARLEPHLDDPLVVDAMIVNLRAEARYRRAAGSIATALDQLERGLELADRAAQIRDLRLDQLPLLQSRDPELRSAVLDDLETRAGATVLDPNWLADESRWLSFTGESGGRLLPITTRAWVGVQRGLDDEERGRFADALEHWHVVLHDFAGTPVAEQTPLGPLVVGRIQTLLTLGGTQLYEPFETRARGELGAALASGDIEGLERLPDRYPFAESARDARRALVDLALSAGDAERLFSAANELLLLAPDADERADLELRMASVMARSGNREAERALLERVARIDPERVLDVEPWEGQRLSAVLERMPTVDVEPAPSASFGPALERTAEFGGSWLLLGPAPRGALADDSGATPPWLVARGRRLEAFGTDDLDAPRWSAELPLDFVPLRSDDLWALTPTRALCGSSDSLVGIDLKNGDTAWKRRLPGVRLDSLCADAGLVVAAATDEDDRRRTVLFAFDAVTGAELWRHTLPDSLGWWPPILADGHLAVLATDMDGTNRVAALDPFTGALRGVLPLADRLVSRDGKLPWIQAGRLILPSTYTQRVTALDLETLEEAWSYSIDTDRDLYALLRWGSKLYIQTTPDSIRSSAPRGALIELDPRLGASRTVHTLERGESIVGNHRAQRTELDQPYVFSIRPSDRGTIELTAIDVRRGPRWTRELDVKKERFYDVQWSASAVSDTSVALVWAERQRRAGERHRVWLDLFDLRDGTQRQHLELEDGYTGFDRIELSADGARLWIAGEGARGIQDRIDLWNQR